MAICNIPQRQVYNSEIYDDTLNPLHAESGSNLEEDLNYIRSVLKHIHGNGITDVNLNWHTPLEGHTIPEVLAALAGLDNDITNLEQYVDLTFVRKDGDTITGELTINGKLIVDGEYELDVSGVSVLGKGTEGDGPAVSLVAGTNSVLRRKASGNLAFGKLTADHFESGTFDYSLLPNIAARSVLGVKGSSSATPAAITAGDNGVLRRSDGGDLEFGSLSSAHLGNKAVTYAKIQDVTSYSVLARAGNADGGVGALRAADANRVLMRPNSGNLTFAQVDARQVVSSGENGIATLSGDQTLTGTKYFSGTLRIPIK